MAKKKTLQPAPPNLMKLGKRLKELRKEKGYTNHFDFAYDHGINPAQYGKYESGRGNITWLKLMELIAALDVSVAEFFSEGFE